MYIGVVTLFNLENVTRVGDPVTDIRDYNTKYLGKEDTQSIYS